MLFRKRILPCFLVLALFVTMFGALGTDEAYAASMKKAAKKIKVQVTSVSQNSATLSWNKIKKPDKGYAVFRNGAPIAYLGKKATSYTDTGIVAGTAYNYQIKTYKVKKVKKKKKYTYKKKSNVVSITTPAAPAPAPAPSDSQQTTPSLTVSESSVVLLKGDDNSYTVDVTAVNIDSISYERNNNNVSCYWGDWIDDDTCELTITGMKEGSSVVTVYDTNNPSLKIKITVQVVLGQKLLEYDISELGYVNGNGDETFRYQIDDNTTTYFVNHSGYVELICFTNTSSYSGYATLEVPLYEATMYKATVQTTHSAYVNSSTYTKNTKLSFRDSSGNLPADAVLNLYNSTFRVAMSAWNLALQYNFGITINDLGFESY